MLTLYHAWGSSCSRRVRFCLAEKELDYESRPMDLFAFEHHSPEYKAINPNGVVPALVHDGTPLVESTIINEYLDEVFPAAPLRPAAPLARAAMRVWTKFIDDVCLPAILVCNWNQVMHPIAREWSDAEREARLAAVPTEERREIWRRMAREPFSEAEVAAATGQLCDGVARMEVALAEAPWLAGDSLSLADINMTPYVRRVVDLAPDALSPARHPKAADWWQRITARPAYRAARMDAFAAPTGD